MAETSKKSTKSGTTKKKTTAAKTSTAKKSSSVKATTKKVNVANKSTKDIKVNKEVKPEVVVKENKKEVKVNDIPTTSVATKNSDAIAYVKSIPERVKKDSVLVIIAIVVGILIGMGTLALLGFRRMVKLSNGEEVVVSLSSSNITANDLYQELKKGYGLTLLLDKIDQTILNSQYPDTDEITTYINSQVEYLKATYGDQFDDYIQYYGFENEEKVREYFSLNYKRNLALLDYAKGLVTDNEVNKYYEEDVFGDIEASHILIKFDSSDSDAKNKALSTAKDIINQLKKASDVPTRFAELAKEYSDDTTNKENGGKLGYFGVGEMEETFEDAAKRLEVGAYTTTPVETSYGYHIILKTNQKEKTALSEMRSSIVETLAENLLTADNTTQYKALEELRNNNKVSFKDAELREKYEAYLKDLYSSKNSQE